MTVKKLPLDILTILIIALVILGGLWIGGEHLGHEIGEVRGLWMPVVAVCALILTAIAAMGPWINRSQAGSILKRWLRIHQRTLPAEQESVKDARIQSHQALDALRRELRSVHGRFWRYRQPWLLLTGDDDVICSFLPELQAQQWLVTPDTVLLWSKTGAHGQPDEAWLKQLYKLRRRRAVDAVVWMISAGSTLSPQARNNPQQVVLSRIAELLHWRAPLQILEVVSTKDPHCGGDLVIGGDFLPPANADTIGTVLRTLRNRLVPVFLDQLRNNLSKIYVGELSRYLDTRADQLATWIANLNHTHHRHMAGAVYFAAQYESQALTSAPAPESSLSASQTPSRADLPLWRHLSGIACRLSGRRVGWRPEMVLCSIALGAIGIWISGMLLSAAVNQRDILALRQTVEHAEQAPGVAERMHGLLALQQEISRYEYRTQHRAPLASRFGLNRDDAILNALWRPYETASQRMLVAPVQQTLETELVDLSQLRRDQLDKQANPFALDGHQTLKSYLMLAEPQRSEAAFLMPQLIRRWQPDTQLPAREQHDLAGRLWLFHSSHLASHPEWRITPSAGLVEASRQTLLAAIGVEHADSTLYRNIINAATGKYPDQTLLSLIAGTDPRGLMHNNAIVSGTFTRQAYEGSIAPAIAEAAQRNTVVSDWVLTGHAQQTAAESPARSPEALQAMLTAQYFAEYAEQWQMFMNNVQWEAALTMPATIEQLKLMTDTRRSPVIALMKSLQYQGSAGVQQASLSDTRVKQILPASAKSAAPQVQQPDPNGPLGSTFGPVMRLIGNLDGSAGSVGANAGATGSDLSLQRYLDRIIALRLRLQQINSSSDAEVQSKQLALSLFQGKGSELADTQAYAQLVAASLGEQWASMGDALFVRPVTQATQAVLQPAQAGLDEAWNNNVVAAWYKAFNGRYPFVRTDNDASLPELARFLRPQGGLIVAFLQSQLAGVLELQGDRWVPTMGNKLNFDPFFLTAINTLQRIGTRLLVQGEPQYRFELKPVPTPGITDTVLTVDAQQLHYYNQRETWQHMVWPVNQTQDAGTRLQWQTEQAGTSKHYEFSGRWALIRLLERARIEPIDSATYQLTWQATPDGSAPTQTDAAASGAEQEADPDNLLPSAPMEVASAGLTYPLSYLMRTEAGRGPLEMLTLRDFSLPSRIFMSSPRYTGTKKSAS